MHGIDHSKGKPAIAYVGETPWHGLGARLPAGADIETWREAAGFGWDVHRSPVRFDANRNDEIESADEERREDLIDFKGRNVLYRSDTRDALSVVSDGYNVVQPSEVLDFFAQLSEIGGFELETAGVLSGGKRLWGLAKVSDGAPVVGQDVVRPYVLFATSYDATLSTTAKFTSVRVVCNNTLSMSVGGSYATGMAGAKVEGDTADRPVSSLVRIPHSKQVDFDKVRLDLGIVSNVFERWLVEAHMMAERPMAEAQFDVFLGQLLDPFTAKTVNGKPAKPVSETKPFQRIKSIYQDQLIGGDLAGVDNRWRALNAITQWVDFERGRTADTRLTGAWFGVGNAIKDNAQTLLTGQAEFEPA